MRGCLSRWEDRRTDGKSVFLMFVRSSSLCEEMSGACKCAADCAWQRNSFCTYLRQNQRGHSAAKAERPLFLQKEIREVAAQVFYIAH